MGHKRKMLDKELSYVSYSDIVHPDRRISKDEQAKEERRHQKGKKRVAVWIKQEVLEYEETLRTLQIELLKMQNHIKDQGKKLLVIFEGRDASGKGGTIKRITEHLNPRGARIVALDKPSNRQVTQWFFQRYTPHLPSAGELVLFDRSWYNRAGVEPVMGFCTKQEHQNFLQEVPLFEHMLVQSQIIIVKFYFSVSKKEQQKRFKKRKTDPLKQFKLSPVDKQAHALWDEYTKAKFSMLKASHTEHAPWTIIKSDNKKQARLNAIKYLLNRVDYPNKLDDGTLTIDTTYVKTGQEEIDAMQEYFTQQGILGQVFEGPSN